MYDPHPICPWFQPMTLKCNNPLMISRGQMLLKVLENPFDKQIIKQLYIIFSLPWSFSAACVVYRRWHWSWLKPRSDWLSRAAAAAGRVSLAFNSRNTCRRRHSSETGINGWVYISSKPPSPTSPLFIVHAKLGHSDAASIKLQAFKQAVYRYKSFKYSTWKGGKGR